MRRPDATGGRNADGRPTADEPSRTVRPDQPGWRSTSGCGSRDRLLRPDHRHGLQRHRSLAPDSPASSPRRDGSGDHHDAGVIIAVLVQPTIGAISDYTIDALGAAQAVHRHRDDARHGLPARLRPSSAWIGRSQRSSSCCSSARTSPRGRSRATCRTSSRPAGRPGQRADRADASCSATRPAGHPRGRGDRVGNPRAAVFVLMAVEW